jgi:hypothetical protein
MRWLAVALVALAPHVTHDTLPVYVGVHGGVDYEYSWGGNTAPLPKLAVLRRRRTMVDLLPRPAQMFARFTHGRADRSHLLIAVGGQQVFAFPGAHGQLCLMRAPRGGGSCLTSLLDGAYPQVEAGRDVWGIVDDGAVRVDVTAARRIVRAKLGHNAFFLALKAIPTRIVVHERNRDEHVYTVKRCKVDVSPLPSPLAPQPC